MPDLSLEREMIATGHVPVAGVDEAGRGPLAGPVMAAAVILPDDFHHDVLRDSKKLTSKQRERLFEEITGNEAITWHCASAGIEDIEEHNILGATWLAMRRAVEGLARRPAIALVDGRPVRGLTVPHRAVVKGDDLSFSIAAAAIVAKVTRDRLMLEYAEQYPEYGFESHKGYGTQKHLESLRIHGPCPIHRASFGPVAQFAPGFDKAGAEG